MADLGPGPWGVDTSVFIYLIEEHPQFLPLLEPVFKEVDRGRTELVTWALTLLDLPSCGRRHGGGPGLPGELGLVERQPDDNMRVSENHLRLPHSSEEIAGETTSPTTAPLPARKLKIASLSVLMGTSLATCELCGRAFRLSWDEAFVTGHTVNPTRAIK